MSLRSTILCLLALALAGAACGDSATSDAVRGSTSAVDVTAAPTADPQDGSEHRLIEGGLTTSVFGSPLDLDLAASAVVVAEAPGLIALSPVDGSPDDVVLVLDPTGIVIDPVSLATAPFPGDLGAWLDAAPHVQVVAPVDLAGRTGWQVTVADEVVGDRCSLGDRCMPLLTSDEIPLIPISESGRKGFWMLQIADLEVPLTLFVQASSDARSDVLNLAADVVEDLCFCAEAPTVTEPAAPKSLQIDFGSTLEQGLYSSVGGGLLLDLAIDEPLDDVTIGYVSNEFAVFFIRSLEEQIGLLLFEEALLVDPSAIDETNQGPRIATYPDQDFARWLSEVPEVVELGSGSASLGGIDAEWWDIEMVDGLADDATYECENWTETVEETTAGKCLSITVSPVGRGGAQLLAGEQMRVYILDGIDAHVVIISAGRLPEAVAAAERVFAQLSLSAAPPSSRENDLQTFVDDALALPSSPDAEVFCAEARTPARQDAQTPTELEVAWDSELDFFRSMVVAAPEEIRSAQAVLYGGVVRFTDRLAEADWDLASVPGPDLVPLQPEFVAWADVEEYLARECE